MTTILVVEDEPAIALGLEEDLALEGYGVEVVRDGDVAVRRARDGGFGMILLDVMLPGKDGFQVCRELRRLGVHTPIILLTARTHEADKVLGLHLGADDYVCKPFSPLELRARIQAVLRRASPPGAADVYRFSDIELDFARAEVRRKGAVIDMTPLEFKLLTVFVANVGRALSRQLLLDKVWSDTACVDRVIDTHVLNLRRKLEVNPSDPRHIVSIRGIGYRFDA